MNLRENNYTLKFPEKTILGFEERVLASGLCDFAIPMQFTTSSKGVKIVSYECSGYAALCELKKSNLRDVYEILEKTMITLSKVNEFLIDINKITLDMNTVFYHLKHKDIKLAYVPEPGSEMIHKKILRFIDELGKDAEPRTREYLSRTGDAIHRHNYCLDDIIRYIGTLKQEMYLCGIR